MSTKKDSQKGVPVVPVCPDCGSTDVTADAFTDWDDELQKWVLVSISEYGYCQQCQDTTRAFKWEEIHDL